LVLDRVPGRILVAAVDGDEFPDVVAISAGRRITVLRNDGGAGFVALDVAVGDGPLEDVAVADVDGDGNTDLLTPSSLAVSILPGLR
jgi:hypothetical protein